MHELMFFSAAVSNLADLYELKMQPAANLRRSCHSSLLQQAINLMQITSATMLNVSYIYMSFEQTHCTRRTLKQIV